MFTQKATARINLMVHSELIEKVKEKLVQVNNKRGENIKKVTTSSLIVSLLTVYLEKEG